MSDPRTAAVSAQAFRAAGVCLALWTLLHPWDQLAGEEAARSGGWLASHTFHFLAGTFSCAALPLLYAARRELFDSAGTIAALAVAFLGSALFAGTGLFTAFLWPTLAEHAAPLVRAHGPFFTPPHPLILITGLLLTFGYVLLALLLGRKGMLSGARSALLAVGFLMLLIPPPPLAPVPWAVFALAGVVAGVGLFALGGAVTHAAPTATATATAPEVRV